MLSDTRGLLMLSGKRGKRELVGGEKEGKGRESEGDHCCCPLLATTLPYSTPSG